MHRWPVAAALATCTLVFAAEAHAQCQYAACQSDGAVNLPGGWDISLPFEDGERVRVLSGYGPTGGSSLHCRAQDSSCANDWYALDLVLPDHPSSGKGRPVLAIADGEVISADWGSAGWANYGRRVYLRHTVGGESYTSMYAHLDSLSVQNGQQVQKGEQLGTLGQSCQGADSCGSFSTPHLHFSIHRGANFGGSGTGGSYGGRAVIPEPIDGYTGLARGQDLTSANGGTPDPPDPPDPMGECTLAITADGAVIEEDSPCTMRLGELTDFAGGSGGHAFYAPLVNPSPDYAAGAIYVLQFAEAGRYELHVNIPAGVPDPAAEANYKVSFAGGQTETISVDQAAAAGTEVLLGTWDFDTTSSQWVRLGDNFNDAANQGKNFVMDSLRVNPAGACECATAGEAMTEACPVAGERSRTCDGCHYGEWSVCPPIDDANNGNVNNGNVAPTTGTSGNSNAPDAGGSADGVSATGGCGCGAAGRGAGSIFMLLFAIATLRRRRRSPGAMDYHSSRE